MNFQTNWTHHLRLFNKSWDSNQPEEIGLTVATTWQQRPTLTEETWNLRIDEADFTWCHPWRCFLHDNWGNRDAIMIEPQAAILLVLSDEETSESESVKTSTNLRFDWAHKFFAPVFVPSQASSKSPTFPSTSQIITVYTKPLRFTWFWTLNALRLSSSHSTCQ